MRIAFHPQSRSIGLAEATCHAARGRPGGQRLSRSLPKFDLRKRSGGATNRRRNDLIDMHYYERPILERAFELARTGQFGRVKDLEKALAKEGYSRGDPHIQSPMVRKQLRQICCQSMASQAAIAVPRLA
jgi:hypothetical protein